MSHDPCMDSVRRNYGVPALLGKRVIFRGLPEGPISGHVVWSDGAYLWIRREDTGQKFGPLHPTWKMDYGDGRDHGAETNARLALWNEYLNHRLSRDELAERSKLLPEIPNGHEAWSDAC